MKMLLIIFAVALTQKTFAAARVSCVASSESKVTLIKANDDSSYYISVASDLSSNFVGPIEDRLVTLTQSATADILSDWDGSSGVKISFRKGFLSAALGTSGKSYLKVTYRDIENDLVSHPLKCVVSQ